MTAAWDPSARCQPDSQLLSYQRGHPVSQRRHPCSGDWKLAVLLPLTLGPAMPGAHDSYRFMLPAPSTCLSPPQEGTSTPTAWHPNEQTAGGSPCQPQPPQQNTGPAPHGDGARLGAGTQHPGPELGHTRPLPCTLLPKGHGCQAAVPPGPPAHSTPRCCRHPAQGRVLPGGPQAMREGHLGTFAAWVPGARGPPSSWLPRVGGYPAEAGAQGRWVPGRVGAGAGGAWIWGDRSRG